MAHGLEKLQEKKYILVKELDLSPHIKGLFTMNVEQMALSQKLNLMEHFIVSILPQEKEL
jgi:hypothetical protein